MSLVGPGHIVTTDIYIYVTFICAIETGPYATIPCGTDLYRGEVSGK